MTYFIALKLRLEFLDFNHVIFCSKFHFQSDFQMVVRQNKIGLICIAQRKLTAFSNMIINMQLQVSLSGTCKYFEVIMYLVSFPFDQWPPSAQIKRKWRHVKVKNTIFLLNDNGYKPPQS